MINKTRILDIEFVNFYDYWKTANWGGEDNLDTILAICQHYLRQDASLGKTVDKQTIQLWMIKRIKEAQNGGREFAPQLLSDQLRLWNIAEANYVPRVTATIGINAADIWFATAEAPEGYDTFWVYSLSQKGVITQLGQLESRSEGKDVGFTHSDKGTKVGDKLFVVTRSGVAYSLPSELVPISAQML